MFVCVRLPRSDEFNSVAEDEDRRLFMTGSVCLDRFMVETDLLSASTNKSTQTAWDTNRRTRELSTETLTRWTDRINQVQRECGQKRRCERRTESSKTFYSMFQWWSQGQTNIHHITTRLFAYSDDFSLVPRVFLLRPGKSKVQEIWETFMGHFHMKRFDCFIFFFG